MKKAVVPVPTPIHANTNHVMKLNRFVSVASASSCSRSKSLAESRGS
jgi:hypothetical protein